MKTHFSAAPAAAQDSVYMSTIERSRPNLTISETDVPPWLKEAKAAVRDLAVPKAWIYWADLLVTITIGYGCASVFLDMAGFSWMRALLFGVAVFAIFRASSFVHEIVHLRSRKLRSFQVAWDLLCGIPLLFPSFAYAHHLDHHRCDSYGTDSDGEYLPFGVDPPRLIGYFLLLTLVWPFLVVFRFLFLTPLSFLYPPFRPWLLERFSSFGIVNFRHRLVLSPHTPRAYWAFLDIACSIRVWVPIVLVGLGVFEWTRVALMFLIAASVLSLNFIRALCLHHYLSDEGQVSYVGQLQDSITLPDNPLVTELFVPLGLRFHALHHMFPHLPYHALGRAHRRLMRELPAGSDYHLTVRSGIGAVFYQFWKNTWQEPRKTRHATGHNPHFDASRTAN
ncbi:MAG: fatty acid desaturase [Pirellulales bacterium]|nr:fatty acid desaturase [Pirellulales bacterium]